MSSTEQINALVERFGLSETVKQEIVKILDKACDDAYDKWRKDLYNELDEQKCNNMENVVFKNETSADKKPVISSVAKDYGIVCPNCKTGKGLIWKSYLMFHKRCSWCGANARLRNHPEFGN